MIKRILIIGGYGNFGRFIARRLAHEADLQTDGWMDVGHAALYPTYAIESTRLNPPYLKLAPAP